jgi:hypothetical protein
MTPSVTCCYFQAMNGKFGSAMGDAVEAARADNEPLAARANSAK